MSWLCSQYVSLVFFFLLDIDRIESHPVRKSHMLLSRSPKTRTDPSRSRNHWPTGSNNKTMPITWGEHMLRGRVASKIHCRPAGR